MIQRYMIQSVSKGFADSFAIFVLTLWAVSPHDGSIAAQIIFAAALLALIWCAVERIVRHRSMFAGVVFGPDENHSWICEECSVQFSFSSEEALSAFALEHLDAHEREVVYDPEEDD